MISLMKEGLVNGNHEKRELENGDLLVSTPKYKRRRVSAIRDFPANCGPNVPLVNSNAGGNDIATVENGSLGQEVTPNGKQVPSVEIESQLANSGLNTVEEADAALDSVVETAVSLATHEMQDFAEEEVDVQPVRLSLPNGAEKEASDVVKDITAVDTFNESVTENGIDEEAKPLLEVGSSVNLDGKETKRILEDSLSVPGTGKETKPMLEDYNLVNEIDSVDIFKDLSPLKLKVSDSLNLDKGSPLGLKDKFRRRRVSAVRDFPPFCGPNVIEPTEHSSPVHSGRDILLASSVSNLEIMSTDTEIRGTELLESDLHDCHIVKSEGADKSMYLDSKHNHGDQESAGKEIVLHSQCRDQERNSPETSQDTIVENVREVEQGMMAGPYSPRKQVRSAGKEIVLHSQDRSQENKSLVTVLGSIVENDTEVRQMAGPHCPLKEETSTLSNSISVTKENKIKKNTVAWRGKTVAKKSTLGRDLAKRKLLTAKRIVDDSSGSMISKGSREYDANFGKHLEPSSSSPIRGRNLDVMLPPSITSSSGASDARNKVKETLRLFQSICRKILQGEEAKPEPGSGAVIEKKIKRIDLEAAKIFKKKTKVSVGKEIIGAVPGVEVGDEFQFRVELAIIGVHRLYQGGIDYLNQKGKLLAVSIVASGVYADDMENPNVLIYSGQGGNVVGKNKSPEDQKLQRGNLALKNSISQRNPIRVVRGSKENKASDSSGARDKTLTTYVYDGLYTVDRYYTELGAHGKMVFMFELRRMPGQPELAWKEVKLSKKFKKRQGVCVEDISGGKEVSPVCAVNTLDNEMPPSFSYITKIMYPDWFHPSIPKGCGCIGRCSDSRKCPCVVKNGGEIPYNFNGAIVEAKPVVFECGPSCKCPPSCYNRVTQHGPSVQLEIFKTETRGWGVRSLSFIPSGTFICEYTGELLEEKEAEKRTGSDEYLFDIGRHGNDSSKTGEIDSIDSEEDIGYTIDAAQYGNIGRFVNHSCSPNLYAQDVLYDHEDPKLPHIMLFASDNIPALQELTYNYNYCIGQVRDPNGNIKVKNCYCGSTICVGRMY